jgi:hypothetical protein
MPVSSDLGRGVDDTVGRGQRPCKRKSTAADRHGNVNPKVVDVFEDPKNYKAALGAQRDLAVVGKMPKVPKTPEGIREGLQKFHQVERCSA